MLSPYTRHYAPCKQFDISYRRCKCPKWVQGNLPDGRYLRKSAKTRSWEKAELLCRRLEDGMRQSNPRLAASVGVRFDSCWMDLLASPGRTSARYFLGLRLSLRQDSMTERMAAILGPASL
jgi:hypothetical protein